MFAQGEHTVPTDEAHYAAVSPSAPYTAANVRIPTEGGHVLAGTLALPRQASGPAPAVVLIAGSGDADRDANIFPGYRPFRQLADTLARRGIAVLRLDKRGVGFSTGDFHAATTRDFADDVRSAVAFLRTRADIDADRVGLIGHSEGGMIAPLVAAEDRALAAIVVLAGPAWSGRRVLTHQARQFVLHNPAVPPEARDSAAAAEYEIWMRRAESNRWVAWWLDYDPLATARRVRQPALIVHGETDSQVTPDQAAALASVMRDAGNRDVHVRRFAGVNHLFQADPDGYPGAYTDLPSMSVVPEVLGTVADWTAEQLTRAPAMPRGRGAAAAGHVR